MASLASPFLWEQSCHGNTACLFELEMSSSIPQSTPLHASPLHFLLPSPLLSWLPHLWQASCCQSKSLALLKETCNTNGGNVGKMVRHVCSPQKSRGREDFVFGEGEGWKKYIEVGRKMLNDIQKIMMARRMLRTEEREDWKRKGGQQRGREMADEREGVKWLIFALSGASGISVTMLSHLSGLSDLTACVIKGGREIYAHRDSFRKRGQKKCNRLWESLIKTKESGGVVMSVQMRGGGVVLFHRVRMNVEIERD